MAPREVLRAARNLSRRLTEQQVPHALAGGLAVGLHGYNRATRQADFLISRSARKDIEELGPSTPISEPLKGLSVTVGRVGINFLFVTKPLRRRDISSAIRIASMPVIGLDALVSMKVVAGRHMDTIDVIEMLKLGKVSVEKVSERLSGEHLEHFQCLVTIAGLEQAGKPKEGQRLLVAMLGKSA